MSLISVFLCDYCHWSVGSLSSLNLSDADFDFNCEAECGEYVAEDRQGPELQQLCTSMEKSYNCQPGEENRKKQAEKKKKPKSHHDNDEASRIVGGRVEHSSGPRDLLRHRDRRAGTE